MCIKLRHKIVIAGAGFGGLWAARHLAGSDAEVLVVDRNNYHTFLPLLYQVAAAEIEPEAIARPVRSTLLDQANLHFVMADIQSIDYERKIVHCNDRDIFYDYLVLATGSRTDFYGVKGAKEHSYELKNLEQGIELRNRIISQLEQASVEPDPGKRKQLLGFAIVGGGPTGVEYAGTLSELISGIVPREYPSLDPEEIRFTLLEADKRLLPGMQPALSTYAQIRLERMGVKVHTGAAVKLVTSGGIVYGSNESLEASTVVWTAGVRASLSDSGYDLPQTPGGRILVNRYLQVIDHPQTYAVGDLALVQDSSSELPMMAPVATSQGETAAENILRDIANRPLIPYNYNDRGNMVTIGRNHAVANLFGRPFTGFTAWVIWLAVHLFNLIGFRNRLLVLLGWAWSYFFFERTVKLIIPNKQGAGGRAGSAPEDSRRVHCRQSSPAGREWPHHVRSTTD